MLALIARGFTLGLTAGILPGPLQTYLIQTTLLQGWRKALVIVIAPLLGDLPLIVLTVLVLQQFPPEFIRVIQIVGGLFVLWLARAAWLNFRAGTLIAASDGVPLLSTRQLLTRSVLINLLNPSPYIFWGTVNGPLLIEGLRTSIFAGAAFLIAFYGTMMGILLALIAVFNRVRLLDPRVTRAALLLVTLLLLIFGLTLIAQGIGLTA